MLLIVVDGILFLVTGWADVWFDTWNRCLSCIYRGRVWWNNTLSLHSCLSTH